MDFPFELSSFKREQLNNWYSVNSFFWAKTTANILPQVWSQNCIFSNINLLITGHHPAVFRYHFLHHDLSTSGIFKTPTLSNDFLFMQVISRETPLFIEICDLLQVCYWKLGRNCNDFRPVFQIVQKRFS